MPQKQQRMERERQTVEAMLQIYCTDHHGNRTSRCGTCEELHHYVLGRLSHCPYQPEKPTCAQCPTHCYKADMRARIRDVMRYAGPRMLWRHPVLALRHLWDERHEPPAARRVKVTIAHQEHEKKV